MKGEPSKVETSIKSWSVYLFIIVSNVILWEHVARINAFIYKPTFFLGIIAEASKTLFYHLGRYFAYFSSFIKYLHLEELSHTCKELTFAITELLFSWTKTIKGYFDFITERKFEMSYVTTGSLIIVLITLSILGVLIQNVRRSVRENGDWAFWRYLPRNTSPCRNLHESQK